MTTGPNLVLYGELTADLVDTLTAVMRVVEQGDDETAANVARSELPGLVAGIRTVLGEHTPDENGDCRKCSVGWWRRPQHAPCPSLRNITRAVRTNTVINAEA